jgi:putative effector of murein hydrolase
MTGSPVDVGRQDLLRYSRGGRAFLQALVAGAATLVLASVLSVVGFWLATYDAERSHIPGHWLFRSLAIAPAIVQLAYVVPVRRALLARGNVMIARGILVGAVAAIILNLAVVGIAAWMTRGAD